MKIEEGKRLAVAGSWTQDTSGLSHQCSATEPRQPDNHQPSQSPMCTAQVILSNYNKKKHSAWVLSWWREFSGQPLRDFWCHILSGCQVCSWGIQYHRNWNFKQKDYHKVSRCTHFVRSHTYCPYMAQVHVQWTVYDTYIYTYTYIRKIPPFNSLSRSPKLSVIRHSVCFWCWNLTW